jgi:hypothetical protein
LARRLCEISAGRTFKWDFSITPLQITEQHIQLTAMLGKRKRGAPNIVMPSPGNSSSASQEDLQDIFKRHFEAQFQPLPDQQHLVVSNELTESDLDQDEQISDWDGISTDESRASVEVVEYTLPNKAERAELSKEELKGFMV